MAEESILHTAEGPLGDALRAGAAITRFKDIDGVPVAVLPSEEGEWRTEIIDVEQHLAHPRRKKGALRARDVGSFIDYINRHKTPGTVAWADMAGGIVCYLNDHEQALFTDPSDDDPAEALDQSRAGWRDHTVTLARVKTPSFIAWMVANGKPLSQQEFAEFLEDRMGDIGEPEGAKLVEIASFFQVHNTISFTGGRNLANGAMQLHYAEDIKEGVPGAPTGETTVPSEFRILIRPYRDAPPAPEPEPGKERQADPNQFWTLAKLRYRLEGAKVRFIFRIAEALQDQLDGVHLAAIERVREEADIPVLLAGAAN